MTPVTSPRRGCSWKNRAVFCGPAGSAQSWPVPGLLSSPAGFLLCLPSPACASCFLPSCLTVQMLPSCALWAQLLRLPPAPASWRSWVLPCSGSSSLALSPVDSSSLSFLDSQLCLSSPGFPSLAGLDTPQPTSRAASRLACVSAGPPASDELVSHDSLISATAAGRVKPGPATPTGPQPNSALPCLCS